MATKDNFDVLIKNGAKCNCPYSLVDQFIAEGWVRADEKPKDKPKPIAVVDGDKGDGELGSVQWNANAIASMESKEEVLELMENLGITIDKRGSLATIKTKAISAL